MPQYIHMYSYKIQPSTTSIYMCASPLYSYMRRIFIYCYMHQDSTINHLCSYMCASLFYSYMCANPFYSYKRWFYNYWYIHQDSRIKHLCSCIDMCTKIQSINHWCSYKYQAHDVKMLLSKYESWLICIHICANIEFCNIRIFIYGYVP